MFEVTIRELLYSEVDLIRYLQPNGWSDISFFFRLYARCGFCFPFAAVYKNRIVGVAAGIQNKNTGWIAHIIVAPGYYKNGIGKKLTEHVVKTLSGKGCTTQMLIATKMGEKLYEQIGFKTSCVYDFFEAKQITGYSHPPEIRKITDKDHDQIYTMDKMISGEEREAMLKMYIANGWIYEDKNSENIKGYFLPMLGEGMISAIDDEAGTALLNFKHCLNKSKTTIPQANKSAAEFLEKNGFVKTLSAPRMTLGNEIDWKPESVYSRIGGHYA